MVARSPQLPLQLSPRRGSRLETYLAGPNAGTVEALTALLDEEGASAYLWGPPGSGKTHLLGGLCLAARERGMQASFLALRRLPLAAMRSFEGLGHWNLACIDDLDAAAGDGEREEAVFHAFNRVRAGGGRVVVAGAAPLSAMALGLPDLRSRLGWGLQLALEPLDDGAKLEVLRRRAADLGIVLADEVQDYLIRHGDRNLGALVEALERVQEAAFREKRRITVPLVRRVLAEAD